MVSFNDNPAWEPVHINAPGIGGEGSDTEDNKFAITDASQFIWNGSGFGGWLGEFILGDMLPRSLIVLPRLPTTTQLLSIMLANLIYSACDWSHNEPQLFWLFDDKAGKLPSSCSKVGLEVVGA